MFRTAPDMFCVQQESAFRIMVMPCSFPFCSSVGKIADQNENSSRRPEFESQLCTRRLCDFGQVLSSLSSRSLCSTLGTLLTTVQAFMQIKHASEMVGVIPCVKDP